MPKRVCTRLLWRENLGIDDTQTNATQSHDICRAIAWHLSFDCVTYVTQSLRCSSFSLKTVVEHRFPPR